LSGSAFLTGAAALTAALVGVLSRRRGVDAELVVTAALVGFFSPLLAVLVLHGDSAKMRDTPTHRTIRRFLYGTAVALSVIAVTLAVTGGTGYATPVVVAMISVAVARINTPVR
jgi:formate-dependent nitrite reductase membrane component NrfD